MTKMNDKINSQLCSCLIQCRLVRNWSALTHQSQQYSFFSQGAVFLLLSRVSPDERTEVELPGRAVQTDKGDASTSLVLSCVRHGEMAFIAHLARASQ